MLDKVGGPPIVQDFSSPFRSLLGWHGRMGGWRGHHGMSDGFSPCTSSFMEWARCAFDLRLPRARKLPWVG